MANTQQPIAEQTIAKALRKDPELLKLNLPSEEIASRFQDLGIPLNLDEVGIFKDHMADVVRRVKELQNDDLGNISGGTDPKIDEKVRMLSDITAHMAIKMQEAKEKCKDMGEKLKIREYLKNKLQEELGNPPHFKLPTEAIERMRHDHDK